MSNSPLVDIVRLSPNHSGHRTEKIDRITPHCVVGQATAEGIGNCFPAGRNASCNYGIGLDGRVVLVVDEANRSWCSSSRANDQRAVTIECASDNYEPYAMKPAVYDKLVKLCVDICKRNGKQKLLWFGNMSKTLSYAPKSDEMILTVHRWFANKSCPGDWLYNRLGNLASEVTAQLGGAATPESGLYKVQVGAFSNKANAESLLAKVKALGFEAYVTRQGNLHKVQMGAFSKKENAESLLAKVKAEGFDAYITNGSGTNTPTKSATDIAREVIQGKWGNGADRKNRIEAAGYDYDTVQQIVNDMMN